ncbi:twin-arginine translocase TatA/TatE family subunit [Ruania zhangjianzhongii]|uniref:twin-arginine translocase TatA/TatE family subunit n=1 Tax=Ruania zhangjianzhongii TaxID=2603206 RepID=UPI0011CA7557|nr:twin-arginine translocase TatA/TatE family subunit [Ruania zhangjianzhongii]
MLKNPVFWIVIVGLVLLLFGASRLPDIAGNVGKSLKVFKKEIKELQDDTDMSDAKTVLQDDQPHQTSPSTSTSQTTSDQQASQPTSEQRSNDSSTT